MKKTLCLALLICLVNLPTQLQAGKPLSAKFKATRVGRAFDKFIRAKRSNRAEKNPYARQEILSNQTTRTRAEKPNLTTAQSHQHILDKRVIRSIHQARKAKRSSSYPILVRGPVDRSIIGPRSFPAKHIYPNKSYLQHPELETNLTEAYFVAQSNRLYAYYVREMNTRFWPAFKAAKPRFYQEAEALERELKEKGIKLETSQDLAQWTAQQISSTTKNLFIGEIHGYPEIPQFVDELLTLLYKQNPGRKIFLFTEFLKDLEGKDAPLRDKLIEMRDIHHKIYVWETAEQLEIPLIGLESQKWPYDYKLFKADLQSGGYTEFVRTGETPEGLRIRNDHWHKILQDYRKKNPDALFVVYTGSAHSLYCYPLSLAKRFPKETTLMLDLTMEEFREGDSVTRATDHLELLDPDNMSFPQPVLKWKTKDLAELSGFDMRVKVPVKENPFEYKRKK